MDPGRDNARGSETFAFQPLAFHLAGAANGLGGLAGAAFGWFLIMATQLHLAEHALALHLLLERLERLVDVVVTDDNLHLAVCSLGKRITQIGIGRLCTATAAPP